MLIGQDHTGLMCIQIEVIAILLHQIFVAALLHNLSVIDDEDALGVADSAQAMGDDKHRAVLADVAHVLVDDGLGFIIERARRLIED